MYSLVPLERKLNKGALLSEHDREALSAHLGRPRTIAARSEISLQKGEARQAFLVVEGWAYSYKILPEGARQIVEIAIPGDILGMSTLQLRRSDLLAAAATDMVVQDFTADAFEKLVRTSTGTAMALLRNRALDESMTIEHLVDIGRRTAVQRVAHFMLELYERLRAVGLADGGRFRCPLTQPLIADALGLTAIHLNRVLRELRTDGLLTFRDGTVALRNPDALIRLSGFNPSYLDPDARVGRRGEDGTEESEPARSRSRPADPWVAAIGSAGRASRRPAGAIKP
jgi:CRP-like cAMP-binding protein